MNGAAAEEAGRGGQALVGIHRWICEVIGEGKPAARFAPDVEVWTDVGVGAAVIRALVRYEAEHAEQPDKRMEDALVTDALRTCQTALILALSCPEIDDKQSVRVVLQRAARIATEMLDLDRFKVLGPAVELEGEDDD